MTNEDAVHDLVQIAISFEMMDALLPGNVEKMTAADVNGSRWGLAATLIHEFGVCIILVLLFDGDLDWNLANVW